MKVVCKITKEETENLQDLYDMEYAIEDSSILLASNNDLFQQHSDFYERIINDHKKYLNKLNQAWTNIRKKYNVSWDDMEEAVINFVTCEVAIKGKNEKCHLCDGI